MTNSEQLESELNKLPKAYADRIRKIVDKLVNAAEATALDKDTYWQQRYHDLFESCKEKIVYVSPMA